MVSHGNEYWRESDRKVYFLSKGVRNNISEVILDQRPEWKHARGILEGRASQTREQEEQRHWSINILGKFAGNSKESRGWN